MGNEVDFCIDDELENVNVPSEEKKERKVVGACPLCGSDVYEYSWGWGCSRGKDACSFSISRNILKREISDENISDILIKGETGVIDGFIGKNGTVFSAKLRYKDNLEFDFVDDKKSELE